MKYYLYLSDTKVDMLYGQIPDRERHSIATDLKIDLKLLSATFKETPPPETRYSRLRVVCDYIQRHESIGSVEEPQAYFRGSLMMGWGTLYNPPLVGGRIRSSVVFFGGQQGRTVVGLGGSGTHVIGDLSGDGPNLGSSLPFLVDALVEAGDFKGDVDEKWLDHWISITKAQPIKEPLVLTLVQGLTSETMRTRPQQRLEFLARRLLTGNPVRKTEDGVSTDHDTTVVLGSPLYVALAE